MAFSLLSHPVSPASQSILLYQHPATILPFRLSSFAIRSYLSLWSGEASTYGALPSHIVFYPQAAARALADDKTHYLHSPEPPTAKQRTSLLLIALPSVSSFRYNLPSRPKILNSRADLVARVDSQNPGNFQERACRIGIECGTVLLYILAVLQHL